MSLPVNCPSISTVVIPTLSGTKPNHLLFAQPARPLNLAAPGLDFRDTRRQVFVAGVVETWVEQPIFLFQDEEKNENVPGK
jgi:hypothetical protein